MLSDIRFCRISGLVIFSLHSSVHTFIQMWPSRNGVYVGVYNTIVHFMISKETTSQDVERFCV